MNLREIRRLTLIAAAVLALASTAALAGDPSLKRFALQVDAESGIRGHDRTARSVKRRVVASLVPRLENSGYVVHAVKDARKAIKSGQYHAALRLDVNAKPTYYVHSALQYEHQIVADNETGARAWGEFKFFNMVGSKIFVTDGKIGPVESRLHETVGLVGRPLLDDESAVARQLVQHVMDVTVSAPAPTEG